MNQNADAPEHEERGLPPIHARINDLRSDGDRAFAAFERILRQYDFRIRTGGGPRNDYIPAIVFFRIQERCGDTWQQNLESTLHLIRWTWGPAGCQMSTEYTLGIAMFFRRYEGHPSFKVNRLSGTLRRKSPGILSTEGRQLGMKRNTYREHGVFHRLIDLYNPTENDLRPDNPEEDRALRAETIQPIAAPVQKRPTQTTNIRRIPVEPREPEQRVRSIQEKWQADADAGGFMVVTEEGEIEEAVESLVTIREPEKDYTTELLERLTSYALELETIDHPYPDDGTYADLRAKHGLRTEKRTVFQLTDDEEASE